MSEKNNNERKAPKAPKEDGGTEFSTYDSVPGPAVLSSVSMPNFGYLLNERRFQAAVAAMQGLLANSSVSEGDCTIDTMSESAAVLVSRIAVQCADALLAALAKVEK